MNWTPLYIIPGLTFLFWAVVHSLLASRTRDFRILLVLLMAVFLTAAGDVIIGTVFGSVTVAYLIIQLMAPAIIPLACLYFAYMWRPEEIKINFIHVIWLSLPVVLFTASSMLVGINGLENTDAFLERIHGGGGAECAQNRAENAFYLWTVVLFRVVIGIEAIFMLVYSIYLAWRFHFRPKNLYNFLKNKHWRIRVLEVQVSISVIILLGLCIKIYMHHPHGTLLSSFNIILLLVLSVMQFLFGFFALFGTREFISRSDIRTAFRFNYKKETASAVSEDIILDMVGQLSGESIAHVITRLEVQTGAFATGGKTDSPSLSTAILGKVRSNDTLTAQFQQLMMGEQLFLQPGLTLADVAERLHTNKTYVSKMVNQTYNLGFPEVMNILRVDYAEDYLRKHPDATQEEVAKACGFVSASSFNTTFKRITGYTPKVWAARVQ